MCISAYAYSGSEMNGLRQDGVSFLCKNTGEVVGSKESFTLAVPEQNKEQNISPMRVFVHFGFVPEGHTSHATGQPRRASVE